LKNCVRAVGHFGVFPSACGMLAAAPQAIFGNQALAFSDLNKKTLFAKLKYHITQLQYMSALRGDFSI
jgi:hypothetical protein